MSRPSLSKNIDEIITISRSYINTRIELWKLALLEKASLGGAFFISSIIIVLIGAFCLLFISMAFAFWYGQTTGNTAVGFLILTGFYLVLGIIFVLSRKTLVVGPIIRSLSEILYNDDEQDGEEEDEK
jgi:hypothetical protein